MHQHLRMAHTRSKAGCQQGQACSLEGATSMHMGSGSACQCMSAAKPRGLCLLHATASDPQLMLPQSRIHTRQALAHAYHPPCSGQRLLQPHGIQTLQALMRGAPP